MRSLDSSIYEVTYWISWGLIGIEALIKQIKILLIITIKIRELALLDFVNIL